MVSPWQAGGLCVFGNPLSSHLKNQIRPLALIRQDRNTNQSTPPAPILPEKEIGKNRSGGGELGAGGGMCEQCT